MLNIHKQSCKNNGHLFLIEGYIKKFNSVCVCDDKYFGKHCEYNCATYCSSKCILIKVINFYYLGKVKCENSSQYINPIIKEEIFITNLKILHVITTTKSKSRELFGKFLNINYNSKKYYYRYKIK